MTNREYQMYIRVLDLLHDGEKCTAVECEKCKALKGIFFPSHWLAMWRFIDRWSWLILIVALVKMCGPW